MDSNTLYTSVWRYLNEMAKHKKWTRAVQLQWKGRTTMNARMPDTLYASVEATMNELEQEWTDSYENYRCFITLTDTGKLELAVELYEVELPEGTGTLTVDDEVKLRNQINKDAGLKMGTINFTRTRPAPRA